MCNQSIVAAALSELGAVVVSAARGRVVARVEDYDTVRQVAESLVCMGLTSNIVLAQGKTTARWYMEVL